MSMTMAEAYRQISQIREYLHEIGHDGRMEIIDAVELALWAMEREMQSETAASLPSGDLISRSALLLKQRLDDYYARTVLVMDIEDAPAIDAVEVVRCKDCKFSVLLIDSDLRKESPWCYYRGDCRLCTNIELTEDEPFMIEDEFFCAYGSKANVKED